MHTFSKTLYWIINQSGWNILLELDKMKCDVWFYMVIFKDYLICKNSSRAWFQNKGGVMCKLFYDVKEHRNITCFIFIMQLSRMSAETCHKHIRQAGARKVSWNCHNMALNIN